MAINKKVKNLLKHGSDVSPFIMEKTRDGKALVELELNKLENLYSPFSPSPDKYIDDNIGEYLRKRFKQIPLKQQAEIHVHLNEDDKEIHKREATVALKNFSYLKFNSERKKANQTLFMGLALSVISIIFIILISVFNLRAISDLVRLMTDIFLWLFIWEAFILLILQYPEKRQVYLIYANMYVSKISYKLVNKPLCNALKEAQEATQTVANVAQAVLEAAETALSATEAASKQLEVKEQKIEKLEKKLNNNK